MTREDYEKYVGDIDCCFHCMKDIEPKSTIYMIMGATADETSEPGPAVIFHADCFSQIAGTDYMFNWDFSKEKWSF